jgi:hypothetical protein
MSLLHSLGPVLDNFAADDANNFATFFGQPTEDTARVKDGTWVRTTLWDLPTRLGPWQAKCTRNADSGTTDLMWWPRGFNRYQWQSLSIEWSDREVITTLSSCQPEKHTAFYLIRQPKKGPLKCLVHPCSHLLGHCPSGSHHSLGEPAGDDLFSMAALAAHKMPYGMFGAYYRPRYCPVPEFLLEQPLSMAGVRT